MKNNLIVAIMSIVVTLCVTVGVIALIQNTWVGLGIFILCGILVTLTMLIGEKLIYKK